MGAVLKRNIRFRLRWLPALLLSAVALATQAGEQVDVYKNPSCGCCEKWVEHLRRSGFQVRIHDVDDVSAVSSKLGVPERLTACHVAQVGGYVIEGHVPAADVQRLLKDKPKALGLAVPSMPAAAPGMDIAGAGSYDTLLVRTDGGTTVFAHH